jgi:hypothetical protein
MPVRGWIRVSVTSDLFPKVVTQPVKPARADDPAIAAADFRNFLLVDFAILNWGYES